jgi:hypothetical protein
VGRIDDFPLAKSVGKRWKGVHNYINMGVAHM